MFASVIIGKITRLTSALLGLDLARIKGIRLARQPKSDVEVQRGTQLGARAAPKSRALARETIPPPRHYSAYVGAQGAYGNFNKGTGMETSAVLLPLDRVTAFYNFAMVALVIGAIITIAATIGLIWASALKSRYADEHLANALVQQERAKADAARANERAAELLLRSQQARVEQEKVHLELEQVRSITGWRRLSADQHAKIVRALQGHKMTINLLSPSNDPEAIQFAEDIAKTLKDAGMTVNSTTSLLPIPVRGLGMTMSQSEAATVLYAAFHSAGLEINDLPAREPVMIVVGSKTSGFR